MSRYIAAAVRERVRRDANGRCGYCRSSQELVPVPLEVEHIHPVALGGTDAEANLWLACSQCNSAKGVQTHAVDQLDGSRVPLFNPRTQSWSQHFRWEGPLVVGRTDCGRATVHALRLNNNTVVTVRENWISVGWHPPTDQD